MVAVSNRVASPRRPRSGNEGGLAVALRGALAERGGIWFGWSGNVGDDATTEPRITTIENQTYATLDLSARDYEEYYNGYANRTLWPLFHYRLDLTEFSRRNMAGYLRVNSLFANTLAGLLLPDDLVWVHDYHFIPLAEQLRQAGSRQRIGFFLHIPWPALEVFRALPNHRQIVQSLCAYDLIGFQTEDHLRAFHDYIEREIDGEVYPNGRVVAYGRTIRTGAFPIGIDTDAVAELATRAETASQSVRLRDSLRDRALIIGVDRLDYSKGLVERMRAFEQLLDLDPHQRNRVVMLQITPQSRTDVAEYADMRRELEATAGNINGAYAEYDWIPLRYLNKGFTRRILFGFFRQARVGFVTPLRDGMNLVAKEFIAAQAPDNPGVLVLSRFAGAASELKGALLVNPYNTEAMAEALQAALAMPLEERQTRWSGMFEHLQTHDLAAWWTQFVDALAVAPGYS